MVRLVCILIVLVPAAGDRAAADAALAAGRYEEARAIYVKLLEAARDPGTVAELRDRVGRTFLGRGKLWEAEKWFRDSLAARETAEARYHRGLVFYRAARRAAANPVSRGAEVRALLNDAVAEIRRSLALRPASPEGWVLLGLCERDREEPRAEEEAYRKALDLDPGRPDASLYLAYRRERAGDAAGARKLLLAVEPARRTGEHWKALGRLAGRLGDREGMKDAYLRAASLDPGDRAALNGLWNATAYRRLFAEFEVAMKRLLREHPDAWTPRYYLGFLYRTMGRPKDALEAFREAEKRSPGNVEIRHKIADMLLRDLRDERGAIEEYEAILAVDPRDERSRSVLSAVALGKARSGDLEEARKLFEVLRKADPGEWSHTTNLALVLKDLGRPEEALALYREAEEAFPFVAQIPNDRGLLLMGLGRTEEAWAAFREALDRDPGFLDTLQNMGAYSRLEGDLEAALEWFRKAYRRARVVGADLSVFRRYLDMVAREKEGRR